MGELTFNKLIPEITIDVTKVIIKAGEIAFDQVKDAVAEQFVKGRPLPSWAVGPVALYAGGVMLHEKAKELSKITEAGVITGEAAPIAGGYAGVLPDITKSFETPQMFQNLNNNSQTYNNDNRQVNQNNYITTTQPAFDIERDLRYANMMFA